MPSVSVVIPTHNRPEMLAEALASVRAQTFTDYEIIVVSNGESVETCERSRSAAEQAGASWFALDRGNVSAARNFGIERAQGEWIAFLDDDDLWLPEKLERQVAEARRTVADMVVSDCLVVFPDRTVSHHFCLPDEWTYTKALSHRRLCPGPSMVLVRKAVIEVIGFDPRLKWSQDLDAWRRLSWRHSIYLTGDILVRYRRGGHMAATHKRNIRGQSVHGLRQFAKMYRDTPADLRDALPSFFEFAVPRLIDCCWPGTWARFCELRYQLRLRAKALVARLVS